ncbi:hypothetical protein [Agarilytica rhodophyticola]|uniref:hypothetical protein n=1 Tax=Agarilytica rhodophyticola TaxID=1737490 RepID=UPI000B341620|nr:hypothetical protein [Agarilytica rhodophyticola]
MSLPRKGSRVINVEGISYRWLVRARPTYTQACQDGYMVAAVEQENVKGSTLSIKFKWQRPDVAINIHPNSVTPKLVESCIKSAISEGWRRSEPGPTFVYECELDQHRTRLSN